MAADSPVALAVDAAPLLIGLVFTGAFLVAGVRLLRTGLGVAASDVIDASEVHHAEGVVEVEGTAEPAAETLTAPASDTECLGYVHEITTDVGDPHDPALIDNSDPSLAEDEHRGGGAVVERTRELAPFYVADGTGRVLVGDEADLYLGEMERYPDPDDFMYNLFHIDAAGVNQGVYYENEEVMTQISEARRSVDQAERKELYTNAITTLLEDKVHLPAFNYKNAYGVSSRVQDFSVHPVSPINPRLVTDYNNVSL